MVSRKTRQNTNASAAATVAQSIYKILTEHNSGDIRELLAKAFEQADIAVADKCKALSCKMGAAVTVLYIKDDTAYYAWQGNVRLYYKKEKGIQGLHRFCYSRKQIAKSYRILGR